jgi:hypothetical protein
VSLNAATIEVLIAKGLSAADLLEVAMATEVKADRTNAERQARHRARKSNAVTVTGAAPKESKSNPLPSETEVSKGSKRASKNSGFVVPDWVPPEPWAAFVKMRKAMRGVPFTDEAAKGIVDDLARLMQQGHDPEKLLLKAVKRGWRGVFEADDTRGAGRTTGDWTPERKAQLLAGIAEREGSTGPPDRTGHVIQIGQEVQRVGING